MSIRHQRIFVTHNLHYHCRPVVLVILFCTIVNDFLLFLIYYEILHIPNLPFLNADLKEVGCIRIIILAKFTDLPHILVMPTVKGCGNAWRCIESRHEFFISLKWFHLSTIVLHYTFIFVACQLPNPRCPYEECEDVLSAIPTFSFNISVEFPLTRSRYHFFIT